MATNDLPRLHDFLDRAIPIYEQPGGIQVSLVQDINDSTRFIEIVKYETLEDFEQDQIRIEEAPAQKHLIEEWRELLIEPPVVEIWSEFSWDMSGRESESSDRPVS